MRHETMPYGTGSIQKRRRCWWMIYRNADGHTIQENTWTDDPDTARRMLAQRAIVTLRARLRLLQAVVNEKTTTPPADRREDEAPDRGAYGAGRGSIRDDAAKRGESKATKTARGTRA